MKTPWCGPSVESSEQRLQASEGHTHWVQDVRDMGRTGVAQSHTWGTLFSIRPCSVHRPHARPAISSLEVGVAVSAFGHDSRLLLSVVQPSSVSNRVHSKCPNSTDVGDLFHGGCGNIERVPQALRQPRGCFVQSPCCAEDAVLYLTGDTIHAPRVPQGSLNLFRGTGALPTIQASFVPLKAYLV